MSTLVPVEEDNVAANQDYLSISDLAKESLTAFERNWRDLGNVCGITKDWSDLDLDKIQVVLHDSIARPFLTCV